MQKILFVLVKNPTKKNFRGKKRNLGTKTVLLFFSRPKEEKRSFQKLLSWVPSSSSSSSLIIIAREGKTTIARKHARTTTDDISVEIERRFENFFFTLLNKTLSRTEEREWNALSIISQHRRQNEWIDEASCFLIIIIHENANAREKYIIQTKNNRTHHTPTQEYVVPKSIPIAGPSDLDIFVY